jgi:hypothetical protein
MSFSLVMGIEGSLLPSFKAARKNIVQSLSTPFHNYDDVSSEKTQSGACLRAVSTTSVEKVSTRLPGHCPEDVAPSGQCLYRQLFVDVDTLSAHIVCIRPSFPRKRESRSHWF